MTTEIGAAEEARSGEDSQAGVEDYIEVEYPEPHRERTKELLQEHPEIKELFGTNPWTAPLCVGIVSAQIGLAWLMQWAIGNWALGTGAAVGLILVAAYFVGAFLDHSTFAVIHEVAHKRVFRGRWKNEVVGWLANLPHLLPNSSSFRNYHLKHHIYQGDPEWDADLASPKEAEWVGRSTIKKMLWQLFYPFFQSIRTRKFQENGKIPFVTKWVLGNIIVQFAFNAAIVYFIGWWALAYLGASFIFAFGLHPLSARLFQEHFIVEGDQETYSYYGPVNKISMNLFHHNEHHDFPAVPWNNLPKLREIASDLYEEELHYHDSLTRLWLKFLFDPSMTLYSRITRDYAGGTVERK